MPFRAAIHLGKGMAGAAEVDRRRERKAQLRQKIGKIAVPDGILRALPHRRDEDGEDEGDKDGQERRQGKCNARFFQPVGRRKNGNGFRNFVHSAILAFFSEKAKPIRGKTLLFHKKTI